MHVDARLMPALALLQIREDLVDLHVNQERAVHFFILCPQPLAFVLQLRLQGRLVGDVIVEVEQCETHDDIAVEAVGCQVFLLKQNGKWKCVK